MMKTPFHKLLCVAALALAGLAASVALADTQGDPATTGQGTNSCAGTYYAKAMMTNSTGGTWIYPTNGTTSGTFTDASGFGGSYSSCVTVTRRDLKGSWCGTNSVTFPAATNMSYSFTVYVTSQCPPPTNGQPLNLQLNWQ